MYRHYADKHALFQAVVLRECGRAIRDIEARLAVIADMDERIVESFVLVVNGSRQHPLMRRLLDTEPEWLLPHLTIKGQALLDFGRGYIARIRRGVQQMGSLIADLLDYSRMERRSMEPQPLELMAVVQRVLDEHSADIDRLGAQLKLDLPPTTLHVDREGLAVVLRNLVGNALKFSRPGEAPRVEIGARREANGHLVWVRDHGVGFDMKYHDRIFGIFQRLQRAEDYPGTGVGLALVAKAVQRMGGRVRAESQPGQGATFYLEFPA